MLETSPPTVSFRKSLIGPRQTLWNDLLRRLDIVQLTQEADVFRWNLIENGTFAVGSMYNALIQPDVLVGHNKKTSKMKISLKTKVFMWYLYRGVILTPMF